jgi:hypothetical protein
MPYDMRGRAVEALLDVADVEEACGLPLPDDQFRALNARRTDLVIAKLEGTASEQELAELAALQTVVSASSTFEYGWRAERDMLRAMEEGVRVLGRFSQRVMRVCGHIEAAKGRTSLGATSKGADK